MYSPPGLLLLALILGLVLPAPAAAQPAQPVQPSPDIRVDRDGHPYRAWDVAVTGGLHVDDDLREDSPDPYGDDWGGGFGLQADVGRYWSSHFKTELAAAWLTPRELYRDELVPYNGRTAQAFSELDVSRGYVSGAVTWQFLANTFAHPFVSAGVRMQVLNVHKTRAPYGWIYDRYAAQSVTLPPVDVHTREVQVRPYVAAGYKSYLDERTFVRSELSTAFDGRGISHWAVRLGIGVDF